MNKLEKNKTEFNVFVLIVYLNFCFILKYGPVNGVNINNNKNNKINNNNLNKLCTFNRNHELNVRWRIQIKYQHYIFCLL